MYTARKYKKCHDKTLSAGKANKLNDKAYCFFFLYLSKFIHEIRVRRKGFSRIIYAMRRALSFHRWCC